MFSSCFKTFIKHLLIFLFSLYTINEFWHLASNIYQYTCLSENLKLLNPVLQQLLVHHFEKWIHFSFLIFERILAVKQLNHSITCFHVLATYLSRVKV